MALRNDSKITTESANQNGSRTREDNDVYAILHTIQIGLKAPKKQFNSFGRYNYRNCEDILEAVKKVLPISASLTIDDSIELIGDRHYIKSCAQLHYKGNTVKCCAYAREPLSKKGMDESQITGASSSYARKYALNGLFLIDDSEDSDSKDNTEAVKPVNQKLNLLKQLKDEIVSVGISSDTVEKWKEYFKVDSLDKLQENQIKDLIAKINKVAKE